MSSEQRFVRSALPVSIDEVQCRALGADSSSVTKKIAVRCFWWLGHVLSMLIYCLHFCSPIALPLQGWKKRRGDQSMNSRVSMKTFVSVFRFVGTMLIFK